MRLSLILPLIAAVGAANAHAQLSFSSSQTLPTGASPDGVQLADFDGDGDADMVVANSDSNFLSMYSNAAGVLSAATSVPMFGEASAVVARDFDGDMDIDLATANGNTDSMSVLLNDGFGGFFTSGNLTAGSNPRHLTAADLDGDGDADLAVVNRDSNDVSLFMNTGGVFAVGGTFGVGSDPRWITAGDFDGDGDVDLAVVNHDSNSVSVHSDGGAATFSMTANLSLLRPNAVEAADLDGDGDLDLAVTQGEMTPLMNDVVVYRNDGLGGFSGAGIFPTGLDPHGVAVFDADGDGDLDLATADADSNAASILENTGNLTFAPAVGVAVGLKPQQVAAADLDGDGAADLVVTNEDSNTVTVLDNQTVLDFNTFGTGCGGTSGVAPSLSGAGSAVPGGAVALTVAGGLPNAAGVLFVGTQQTALSLAPGCTLYVDFAGMIGSGVPMTLGANGSVQLAATLPAPSPLVDVYLQFMAADQGAPNGVFTASNGLKMSIH